MKNDPHEVLIVETALQTLWNSVPQAAAVWIAMVIIATLAAVAIGLPARRRPVAQVRAATATATDAATDAAAEAAAEAAATAARLREYWLRAQAEVDTAWALYDEADAEARRVAAASAFPVMRRRRALGEKADREHNLHRVATAACRRRELSIAQLNEALAHRGWDPRLHPVAQEAALRNAVREHRLAGYRAATGRERAAWQSLEQASEALRSLRAQALAATVRDGAGLRSAEVQPWSEQWAITQPLPVVTA